MPGTQPIEDRDLIRILESRAFSAGDRERNEAIFCLELSTGARINEILKLKLKDVIDGTGHISKKITIYQSKTGRYRTIDIQNPILEPYLWRWIRKINNAGYVRGDSDLFPSPYKNRQPLTRQQVYNIYRKSFIELNLEGKYGTHSCRKTWAKNTYLFYHGRLLKGEAVDPLLKTQQAGGWKSLDSVKHYLDFLLNDSQESQAAIFPELQKWVKNRFGG